jgi:hypothetical protein
MKPAHLILLFPAYLAIRMILVLMKWLRVGTAGFFGYEYARSVEPGWYWLSIACSLILLAFYFASGIIYGFVLTTQNFEWSSTLNLVYFLLLVSQETGLLRQRNQPA